MIVLEGLSALSAFRRERLQTRLVEIVPDAVIAGAWHVYFVQGEAGASMDANVLGRILEGCSGLNTALTGAAVRIITPRAGTRSPWSSRAWPAHRYHRRPRGR